MQGDASGSRLRDHSNQLGAGQEELALVHVDEVHHSAVSDATGIARLPLDTHAALLPH